MKLSSTEKNKIILRCTDGRTVANDIVSGVVSRDFDLAIRADEVIKLGRVIGKPRMISIIESNGIHYITSAGLNNAILWYAGVKEDIRYPDTDKAIPNRDDCTHVIGINRQLFLAHANNVRKMNERGNDRMDLSFNAVNTITVKSSSHDIDYSGILACNYGLHDRLPFRISLNASYVRRILSTYKPDVIHLEYYAPNMPVIFDMADKTDNESGGQRVLLMPLRVN
jgi:DNA polymerase III sliding clamp (beta) subunit (PCNA family)